jgi:hypothetical protein
MARGNLAKNWPVLPKTSSLGPDATATLIATAAIAMLMIVVLVPLILPVLSIVAIVSAGVVALFAWCSGEDHSSDRFTAWDVSGACAFIGCAAGMLTRPEHIMQVFGLATNGP